MELLTLDSSYQPAELVERYDSLIWTERYSTAGDFQLVSTDVERMLKLLPRETCVTLRESTVPMLVEMHKIEKSITGAPVLTVTGRSFETVLERRAAVKVPSPWTGQPREEWSETENKQSDAAYQAIRQMIGDVAQTTPNVALPAVTPMIHSNDAFPMIEIFQPADFRSGITAASAIEIKPGNLYTVVMELLATSHHGLKSVRPVPASNKVGIEIYNGADLSKTVVFDAKFDQFENATYLLSETASTNWAYVFSKTASVQISKVTIPSGDPGPLGLDRRVLLVDISSEEGVDTAEARKTRGLIELYKYNATALFDGQISEQIAYGYNRNYYLGDIIRLDGEYGLSEIVRVAEFIRSDDNTGSRAYPTFEVIPLEAQ
jgi:hypothetical protein